MKKENKNKLTICLLGVSFESSNMGVQALAHGTIKGIKKIFPDCLMSVLDYGYQRKEYVLWGPVEESRVKFINVRFSKKLLLKNNIAFLIFVALLFKVTPVYIRNRITKNNSWLGDIQSVDLFLALSGGDSFSDIYGFGRFLYVALPQILVIVMGKKIVQLPQTYGPFKYTFTRLIAKYILKNSSLIYARDRESLKTAKEVCSLSQSNNRFNFCYDLGFLMDSKNINNEVANEKLTYPVELEKEKYVGLNVSGLLYMGGYDRSNAFGIKIQYERFIKELIGNLIEHNRKKVLLVPHVFGRDPKSESDWIACLNIYEELNTLYPGKLEFLQSDYDQNEIKYIIGCCEFFIGSRMHSCIAALSQGIPAMALSYSRKFIGVYESLSISDLAVDLREMESDEIIDKLNQLLSYSKETQDKLVKNTSKVEREIEEKLLLIRNVI